MAAVKRKEALVAGLQGGNIQKKLKREEKEEKKPIASKAVPLETETDSEPIMESDTASQSGDDDGTSWPSDTEAEEFGGVSVDDGNDGNGLKIAAEASGAPQSVSKPTFTDGATTGSSSKEYHAKQKVMAQDRKAAKPNADSIARSKKLWERLRRKSHVPTKERKELITELFEIITGRVKDFVFKHDSVRVIQTALKYANLDQQKMIARELKGEYRTLAESRYAKFLIGKMLVRGDEETRDMVVPELCGHVRRMIKHAEASWILDDIYRGIATPSQKATLLREWYGAEFAIFKSSEQGPVSADLKQLLAKYPEKKTPIMRSLHDLINLLVQKKTTGFTMLHDAMLQYFLNVQPGSEEATDFIELLKGDEEGDLLKNLAFTESGARLVCLALAYGNAKDRKQILRTYKDIMQTLAYDSHGHRVILAVYDIIDDTVLVSKSVFPELVGKDPSSEEQQQNLLASTTHLSARITLLYPFCGEAKAILPNEDLELLNEIHRTRITTSKKDPEVRRKELIASLSPPLLQLIASNATELVSTSFGCQFISEVLLGAIGDRQPAMDAVIALTEKDEEAQALLNTPAAGRMLKTLVLGGKFNPATKKAEPVDPPLGFHYRLYAVIKDNIVDWATGCNSFVVVGLLESPGFSEVEKLKEILGRCRKELVKAAGSSEDVPAKPKNKNGKGGKSEGNKPPPTGNKGTQLLLKKL